jgi:hypothetical protein
VQFDATSAVVLTVKFAAEAERAGTVAPSAATIPATTKTARLRMPERH